MFSQEQVSCLDSWSMLTVLQFFIDKKKLECHYEETGISIHILVLLIPFQTQRQVSDIY